MTTTIIESNSSVAANSKNYYPNHNTYNPIKNSTWTPSVDILAGRIEKQYCYIKSRNLRTVYHYTKTDLSVYGILTRYLGKEGISLVFPKIAKIAERAKCSYTAAQRSLSKLESDLIVYSRSTGRGKFYYFIPLNNDGTPDQNSGEYHFAKAILDEKNLSKIQSRLVNLTTQTCQIDNSETAKQSLKIEQHESPLTIAKSTVEHDLKPIEKLASCARAYVRDVIKKPTTKKAPKVAVAAVKKIRKYIDPEISRRISNTVLYSLVDIKTEQIKFASNESMGSNAKNKTGLFLKLVKEEPLGNGIKQVDIPLDANKIQIKCIKCYNANCIKSEWTCTTMMPNSNGIRNKPEGPCKKYCPFVLENSELFR